MQGQVRKRLKSVKVKGKKRTSSLFIECGLTILDKKVNQWQDNNLYHQTEKSVPASTDEDIVKTLMQIK